MSGLFHQKQISELFLSLNINIELFALKFDRNFYSSLKV